MNALPTARQAQFLAYIHHYGIVNGCAPAEADMQRFFQIAAPKKWFERPGRLPAFGLWIAKRAASQKGKTKGAAGALLDEARTLLGTTATREDFLRVVAPRAAKLLHDRAQDFQNEFERHQWGAVRIIHCWPLLLVDRG